MNQMLLRTRGRRAMLAGAARVAAALSLLAITSPLAAQAKNTASITVRDAWVREAPAGRAVTAAFMVIENSGNSARAITKAASDAAETLELHEMKRDGASMSMSPVKSIDVPSGGKVELRPGGLHVMMFGVKKPLADGDAVTIRLTLDDGTVVTVPAKVRGMAGMRP